MEGRGARYVIGYCVTVLTAVLLWCLRQELGGVVMDVLLPVNGSAWEQGKLCFWPYLAGGLLIWRLGEKEDSRGGHCALLVLMPLALTAVCYFAPLHNHQVVLGRGFWCWRRGSPCTDWCCGGICGAGSCCGTRWPF